MPANRPVIVSPAFDPEVLGGDTCALGQCCIDPFGFLVSRLVRYFATNKNSKAYPGEESAFTTSAEIAYILGTYGGWAIIFLFLYPLISASARVANLHKQVGYVVLVFCLASWRLAKTTSPGSITSDNLHVYDNYAYDNILYTSRMCPTMQIRKLARSKYDRHSGHHVPRFDHHCPVLNRTVGEENYRYFLAFLFIHTAMCWYGSVIAWRLLCEPIDIVAGTTATSSTLSTIWTLLRGNLSLSLLAAFLMSAGTCLAAFLGFHLYIISIGMTTNEYYKWKSIQMDDGRRNQDAEAAINVGDVCSAKALTRQRRKNLYNLGVYRNFREVLHPRCQARPKKRI